MAQKKLVIIDQKEAEVFHTKFNVGYSRIRIHEGYTGKMSDMCGVSTSCEDNPLCQKRHNCGNSECVCTSCYAIAGCESYRGDNLSKMIRSNNWIADSIIHTEELLEFNPDNTANGCRFESHGDLQSVPHAVNYLNTAYKNPDTYFAIWTKNPWFLKSAIDIVGKPTNLTTIFSASFLDRPVLWENLPQKYKDIFDYTFSVVREENFERIYESVPDAYICRCGRGSCAHECKHCYGFGARNFGRNILEVLRPVKKSVKKRKTQKGE